MLTAYLGAQIALIRAKRISKKAEARDAQEVKRLDNEGKPLDAMIMLSKNIEMVMETGRERDKAHQEEAREWRLTTNSMLEELVKQREQSARQQEDYRAMGDSRTKQLDHLITINENYAESVGAIQSVLTAIPPRLETIQNQGQTLRETQDMITSLGAAIAKQPDEIQKLLQPLQERMDKLDKDLIDLRSTMVTALNGMAEAAHKPVVVNNINPLPMPAPASLLEVPAKLDLLALEGDPTQPMLGGMPMRPDGLG